MIPRLTDRPILESSWHKFFTDKLCRYSTKNLATPFLAAGLYLILCVSSTLKLDFTEEQKFRSEKCFQSYCFAFFFEYFKGVGK